MKMKERDCSNNADRRPLQRTWYWGVGLRVPYPGTGSRIRSGV